MTEDRQEKFEPASYWRARLSEVGGLRATGHAGYSEAYNRVMYLRKAQVLRRLVPRPVGAALDVGSGRGWVVRTLRRMTVADACGCDIAPEAVSRLAESFGSRFFVYPFGGQLPIRTGSLDLVTLIDVAYHVTEDRAWEAGIRELARVLRPGGRLVATDSFADDTRPSEHVRFRSQASWTAALATSGVVLGRVEPLYRWLSREREASQLRVLPGVVRAFAELGLEQAAGRPAHLSMACFEKPRGDGVRN